MGYCTLNELKESYGETLLIQLADDDGAGSISDSAVVAKIENAIEDATAEINGYVRKRYDVPFAVTPRQIKSICKDLSIMHLYKNRIVAIQIPDSVSDAISYSRDLLGDIAEGTHDLGVEPEPTYSSSVVDTTDGPDRQFDNTKLKYF